MARLFVVEPEVAGGWGRSALAIRTPGEPTIVQKLHYQFDGWLGDELVQSAPCYIVTEGLAREIEKARLSGVTFDEVEITTSDEFKEMHTDLQLPDWVWLKVDGKPGREDFGVAPGLLLVVSQRALDLLKEQGLSHAGIYAFV